MKMRFVLTTALLAASVTAWADNPTPEPARTSSTLTRAEVQAELASFKSAGINPWSSNYNPLRYTASTKSRADLQDELASFKSARINPWSSNYNPLQHAKSTTSRAEVAKAYVDARDQVHAMTSEDSGSGWLAQPAASLSTLVAARPVKAQ